MKNYLGLILGISICLAASLLMLTEVSVGKTHTASQMISTASSSTPQDAILCLRRILITQDQPDTLLSHLGQQIAQGLSNLPPVERVVQAEMGQNGVKLPYWPVGQPLPDLFVRLQNIETKRTGILAQSAEYKIRATLSSAPSVSTHHYMDDTTAPVVAFEWRCEIEHRRETKGWGLNRTKVIAEEIADQLLKSISNHVTSLRKDHPTATTAQNALIPPYQAVPSIKAIENLHPVMICSGPRLMSPNETFWIIPALTNPVQVLASLKESLIPAGWKVQSSESDSQPFLRLRQERQSLECYAVSETDPFKRSLEKDSSLIIHYREAIDPQQLDAQLEAITQTVSWEELLPFRHKLSPKQQARFWERLKASPTPSALILAVLAENELSKRHTNEARNFASLARFLEYESMSEAKLSSRLDDLEKKIGKIQWAEFSPENLGSLNFILLDDSTASQTGERVLGEPFRLAWRKPNGEMQLTSLIVTRTGSEKSQAFDFMCAQCQKGSRSMSHSQIQLSSSKDYTHALNTPGLNGQVHLRLAETGNRVKYQFARR